MQAALNLSNLFSIIKSYINYDISCLFLWFNFDFDLESHCQFLTRGVQSWKFQWSSQPSRTPRIRPKQRRIAARNDNPDKHGQHFIVLASALRILQLNVEVMSSKDVKSIRKQQHCNVTSFIIICSSFCSSFILLLQNVCRKRVQITQYTLKMPIRGLHGPEALTEWAGPGHEIMLRKRVGPGRRFSGPGRFSANLNFSKDHLHLRYPILIFPPYSLFSHPY